MFWLVVFVSLSVLGAFAVIIFHIYFPVWQRDIMKENREVYAKYVRSGLDPAKGQYRRYELIDYLKFIRLTHSLEFVDSDGLKRIEKKREQKRKDKELDQQIRQFINNDR